ncbi:peptidase T. Metallo peptidase. MEROPS family M20B [Bellilinea caldifistulae]|uniref:Peptidase T n=1 Tax=Bellilinea caldifistulae TaxID=360411 RepID=A0A0P6WLZ4_9CHLR|nr:peptidase T [Bellilinea caldifistulae]KPL70829.1 peptidase T [Bellilinea caldifistulae]GAP10955.1 peptidase T. Metallo peptidase. MEROPS family M20B [Bellilinea caldifistulae]
MKTSVVDRFIRYAKIHTESDPASESFPSTSRQLNLAKLLVEELKQVGLVDISLDENGYVMATLPANVENAPTIGFIAHMDTNPDMTGENVNPQIVHYQGGDIILNPEKNIVLSPQDFPVLNNYIGQTLITTDGNTLLGADDKAGIAEIMAAVEYLVQHPEIPHAAIRVGFTPDEEIGRGADRFDVQKFNADFAYTMDGGEIGELQYENFNAANAKIFIQGRNVHPGTAKNQMINALQIAINLHQMLPPHLRPEHTDHYEGFFHLTHIQGSVDSAEMRYIIREHDRQRFEEMKALLLRAIQFQNELYGSERIKIDLRDSYYNMKEKILPVMHIIELAKQAMLDVGVTPIIRPVRGGTDGARLSYMGLPCPNIFNGGHNYHGRYEFIPVESMEKAVQVIVRIAELAIQD